MQSKLNLVALLGEAIKDEKLSVFDATASTLETVKAPACFNGDTIQLCVAGEGRKNNHATNDIQLKITTDKALASEIRRGLEEVEKFFCIKPK